MHNDCVGEIEADLGKKADYAFGKATGNSHTLDRTNQNALQLKKIGINDTAVGRDIFSNHFKNVFRVHKDVIMNSSGRVKINSLLAGPAGFRGVESIWDGNKLISFIFFGG